MYNGGTYPGCDGCTTVVYTRVGSIPWWYIPGREAYPGVYIRVGGIPWCIYPGGRLAWCIYPTMYHPGIPPVYTPPYPPGYTLHPAVHGQVYTAYCWHTGCPVRTAWALRRRNPWVGASQRPKDERMCYRWRATLRIILPSLRG